MVPQSGRIKSSAIELMSKMLQVFTLSYPRSESGPKVMVLFTDFSASETSNDSGEISFDEEEETNEESQVTGESLNFSLLVSKFREDLVTKLMEDQTLSKS